MQRRHKKCAGGYQSRRDSDNIGNKDGELMTTLNEHQKRLWRSMVTNIGEFRNGRLAYSALVGCLEGALDAGELQDKEIVNEWYDLWTPLEIHRATTGDSVDYRDVAHQLEPFERFVSTVLANVR